MGFRIVGVTYTLDKETYSIECAGAKATLLRKDDRIAAHIAKGTRWEEAAIEEWCSSLEDGTVVLDAGAYTGLYAALAASRGLAAVAVEPRPEATERMHKNFELSGVSVTVVEAALWHREGKGTLHQKNMPLTSGATLNFRGGGPRQTQVDVTTIDKLFEDREQKLSSIKVDVEGAEIRTIEGALQTIARFQPRIIIECLTFSNFQLVKKDIEHYYSKFKKLDDRNWLIE